MSEPPILPAVPPPLPEEAGSGPAKRGRWWVMVLAMAGFPLVIVAYTYLLGGPGHVEGSGRDVGDRNGAEQWSSGAGVLYCASGVFKSKCREPEVSHCAT